MNRNASLSLVVTEFAGRCKAGVEGEGEDRGESKGEVARRESGGQGFL
jgi:hypothetical protein